MDLRVDAVRKEYPASDGARLVLNGVSFTLSPGGSLAITGPSGSGKSTLLNILGSLDRPTSGEVRLGGILVSALEGDALADFRSRHVGFVFQDHHLLPQCTALENVLVPTLARCGEGRPRASAREAVERACRLLEQVGLAERMDAFPARLSGGERQRVAIARALINAPALLLCDEPTGNLDRDTGARIGDLFLRVAEERGVMLVVVTHNLDLASRFGRRAELVGGTLHEEERRGGR